jgi:hypothetical protein
MDVADEIIEAVHHECKGLRHPVERTPFA